MPILCLGLVIPDLRLRRLLNQLLTWSTAISAVFANINLSASVGYGRSRCDLYHSVSTRVACGRKFRRRRSGAHLALIFRTHLAACCANTSLRSAASRSLLLFSRKHVKRMLLSHRGKGRSSHCIKASCRSEVVMGSPSYFFDNACTSNTLLSVSCSSDVSAAL